MPLGTEKVNEMLVSDYAYPRPYKFFRIEMDIPLDDGPYATMEEILQAFKDPNDRDQRARRNEAIVSLLLKVFREPTMDTVEENETARAVIRAAFPYEKL